MSPGVHIHQLDIHREISELVVSSDVSIVCRQGHQEVNQGEDHQGAGHRRQDEHHLWMEI